MSYQTRSRVAVKKRGGGAGSGEAIAPFFTDAFDNGTRNPANGFTWGGVGSGGEPGISSDRAFSGTHSMKFRYGASALGGQAWSEERFFMGRYLTELAFEYMLWVPANFKHRNQDGLGAGSNNKFFSIWRDTYGGTHGSLELSVGWWRTSDTESYCVLQSTGSKSNGIGPMWSVPAFIGPNAALKPGQWSRVRFYYRAPTYRAGFSRTADGIAQLWLNDTLYINYTIGDFNNFNPALDPPTLRSGYFLGYCNSGFDEVTEFFIDDVKFWETQPTWAVVPPVPVVNETLLDGAFTNTSAITWGTPTGGASVGPTSVIEQRPNTLNLVYTGTVSGPTANVSQPFTLASPVTEVWAELQWCVTSNIVFRGTSVTQTNPLLTFGTPDGNAYVQVGYSSNFPYADHTGMLSVVMQRGDTTTPSAIAEPLYNRRLGLIGPIDSAVLPGENAMLRTHIKMASGKTANDGHVKVWINNMLMYDSGPVSLHSASSSSAAAAVQTGLLGGVHLQGYTNTTTINLGHVKLYTADPMWPTLTG